MSIKDCSYCAEKTEVQVGDVLISIDNSAIEELSFDEVLEILKEKQADTGCKLRFQTVEETIRLIRENALHEKSARKQTFTHADLLQYAQYAMSPGEYMNRL